MVWTPAALLAWWGVLERTWKSAGYPPDAPLRIDITVPLILSLAAVFCIARLYGAHR